MPLEPDVGEIDAHGLDNCRKMPMVSMLSNSALAVGNLSGGSMKMNRWSFSDKLWR